MDNTDKTKSTDATTKTDEKTVDNRANAAPSAQGGNKTVNQTGKNAGAQPQQSQQSQQSQQTDAKTAVGDAASGATDTIKDALGQAKETGGAVASQAYGFAAKKATAAIDEHKTNLAAGLTSVADTIRQIGGNLGEAQEPTGVANIAAQYTNTAADKVEQLTGYLERRDFRGLVRDLEDVAHRNPALFLGGAFALGILAARFFKSGNSENTTSVRRTEEQRRLMDTSSGTRVRQLRRKGTGRTDTLNADEFGGATSAAENTGG